MWKMSAMERGGGDGGFWVNNKGGAWGEGTAGERGERKEKGIFPPPFHGKFHGRGEGADLRRKNKGGEKLKNVKKLDKGWGSLGCGERKVVKYGMTGNGRNIGGRGGMGGRGKGFRSWSAKHDPPPPPTRGRVPRD